MKICKNIFICFLVLMFSHCSQNNLTNYKKNFQTGVIVVSKELEFKNYQLLKDQQILQKNHIPLGSKLTMIFSHIMGFKVQNQKVFPGASLKVTDHGNQVVINQKDLFSKYDQTGIEPIDSEHIRISFQTGTPMKPKATYCWESIIWDKKGSASITMIFHFKTE